ncbi:MAG: hypothetical protein A2504_16035 [Bdellovibrionales bacterium RIFOXYD12_FULL_39_22]|nr:MAG: hypothetical protein A2385_07945 [Bdellovibrionales bacterium RIFOXYB1_FULL_39_21]OFZ43009.1 MAG: hypothetical protein A2485_11280 [Bdellovibrionales bacterium RIFOXYC12_FULL_39_17]OFZ50905.1 MAG: hypothetical protein A2404_06860 [Bdellovibrionales bacterium RIFOXYC1_FULL_39_130]OFZ73640.1 MAG: hypothetical protein A2451_06395 [Bdellovibrionales bacterium RIFOXYC2_FULL_39_8]OFZ78128.1 MAG: hypothetical protein A2560_02030 [Bdellovibrionales bacterium RIFOXYD1_FULL_39_84]OFZ93996.1 MAG:
MNILCQISLGELVDKISILRIKKRKIIEQSKLDFVIQEDNVLTATLAKLNITDIRHYLDELIAINSELWEIEDKIRLKERAQKFDDEFISLARSVYIINDRRFVAKNKINRDFGSSLREVKSYEDY